MLSLLAGLVLGQATYQRMTLPNGASIVIERTPKQALASIQLFASSKFAPDSPLTHGYRHLLEHLIARGADGNADAPLEAVGGILRAKTLRDASQFEVTVTPEHLKEGFATLANVLAKKRFTQTEIDREAKTISEEAALADTSTALASAGWSAAYGDRGLDPLGNLETIAKATPEDMEALRDGIFRASAVCLVIVGDVPADTADQASKLLSALGSVPLTPEIRPAGKAGRAEPDGLGEARCAPVPPFDRPSTAAGLAAALALAAQLDGCFVTYTPSMQRGLITLGRTGQNSGVSLYIDSLKREASEKLYGLGRMLARRWYETQVATPQGAASLRGMLLCEDPVADPMQFLAQLDAMTKEEFVEAVRKFQSQNAVTVVGR